MKSWSATTLGAVSGPFRYRTMARGLVTLVPRRHTPVSARALLKRWPVNSMPLWRNPVAQRGRPSQLLQAQEREGAVGKGSGPLDQRSTKQLKSDLAESELTPAQKVIRSGDFAQTSRSQSWGSIANVCVARRRHHSVWLGGGCLNTTGQPWIGRSDNGCRRGHRLSRRVV